MILYRAALIGCGRIGSEFADGPRVDGIYSHAEAYVTCPDTELVAICDVDPAKLERCGQRWNVTTRYSITNDLLSEVKPDIVSICTPDATHYTLVKEAIQSGSVKGILAEKPLALELWQARELVDLAAERGVTLTVNFTRRYADSHVLVRDFILSGGIGTIQTVGGYYTKGTLHNGTHWFDLARFLVGEIVRVWGVNVRKEVGDDPTLDALLEFQNGASGHLQACDANAFSLFEMDLVGSKGRMRLVESGLRFETYTVVDSPYYEGYRTLAPVDGLEGGLGDATLHAIEDLARCMQSGDNPRSSGEDGAAALAVALAVVQSALHGAAISLPTG